VLANKTIIPAKTNITLFNFIIPPLFDIQRYNFPREKQPPARARGVVVSVGR
jgi:hypothetical protein